MTKSTTVSAEAPPLYEQVYDTVRDLILSGGLRAGESISEVKLAERLNVSRTPVREAVRRLVAENLMEAPGRGLLRVYAPTVQDVAEVYFTRAILEGAAAGLAARFADQALISHLEQLTSQMRDAVEAESPQDVAMINGEFHKAIIDASQNQRMIDILAGMEPVILRYRRLSLMFPEHMVRSLAEHQEIMRLFCEGTPELVEVYYRGHILRAGGRIVTAVIQLEGRDSRVNTDIVHLFTELHQDERGTSTKN